jgi:hypothetical protein
MDRPYQLYGRVRPPHRKRHFRADEAIPANTWILVTFHTCSDFLAVVLLQVGGPNAKLQATIGDNKKDETSEAWQNKALHTSWGGIRKLRGRGICRAFFLSIIIIGHISA